LNSEEEAVCHGSPAVVVHWAGTEPTCQLWYPLVAHPIDPTVLLCGAGCSGICTRGQGVISRSSSWADSGGGVDRPSGSHGDLRAYGDTGRNSPAHGDFGADAYPILAHSEACPRGSADSDASTATGYRYTRPTASDQSHSDCVHNQSGHANADGDPATQPNTNLHSHRVTNAHDDSDRGS
jgi:hypothetical protein